MTGEPTVNIPLLRKVMDHITAHPEEHDQSAWAYRNDCGTTMCIAGWAATFAGHRVDWAHASSESCTVDGDAALISQVARDALGLTDQQADRLFMDAFALCHIWDVVEDITAGELSRPAPS